MLNRIASALILAAMAVVFALFQLKMIAPGDAFFIAVAIVVVFTGQQLIAREHMGLAHAAELAQPPVVCRLLRLPRAWRRGDGAGVRVHLNATFSPSLKGWAPFFCFLQHRQHCGDERVADDVAILEPDDRDVVERRQAVGDLT